jgi:molybdopterin/thiamine biosynthesis adenylyltransferase
MEYTPLLFTPIDKEQKKIIQHYFGNLPNERIVDQLDQQIEELFFIRNPSRQHSTITKKDISNFQKNLFGNISLEDVGTWVYYPWNNYLVHFLPEQLHFEIRTARNRNLITRSEQDIFFHAHIGIAGLSVGNSAMATVLYTGGANNLKLADHDVLSASNLNRIRSSFTKLGVKKVHIAAQEIYEINPYAALQLFPDGLQKDNLSQFLLHPKPLDLLIEEMDSIYQKIQIRLLARTYKIPVIMAADNGDNVVLDIERFDLEPNRPLFHGDIPEEELLRIQPDIPKIEAARLITRLVHPDNVAVRMQQSVMELGKTLYSWPQLGNAAFLAGCSLAYSARKILLKEDIKSGKYLLNLDELIMNVHNDNSFQELKQKTTKHYKDMLNI